jgi:glucokinase
MILGIDVGGTSVKFGLVTPTGEIKHGKRFMTADWVNGAGFVEGLKLEIGNYLKEFPNVKGVGIGWPGLLSEDRKRVLLLPNIKSVKDCPIVDILKSAYPSITFRIENDAKCAAIGEYHFGSNKKQTFLLMALGTGVGAGVVINGRLFIGGRGNGTEVGHMISSTGDTLENNIGISHIINYTKEQLKKDTGITSSLHGEEELSPKVIFDHAQKGDKIAVEVFERLGRLLGEGIVSIIRVLDINHVILGGGISGAYDQFVPEVKKTIEKWLPEYYTKDLTISKATLDNDAGLLGAAGLILSID